MSTTNLTFNFRHIVGGKQLVAVPGPDLADRLTVSDLATG